jgi:hypothetical protein
MNLPKKPPPPTWNPDLIRKVAQTLTGHKGSEALNRFAKQLVIGSCIDKGFVSKENENLREVYELPFVRLGTFNVLTRFSFLSNGSYTWDFAGGITEGQKLSGFASDKGRRSQWVGDGVKKEWEDNNVTGVTLCGFHETDVEFFYLTRDEFLALQRDRITLKKDCEQLQVWAKAWKDLCLQPTFSSLMGHT